MPYLPERLAISSLYPIYKAHSDLTLGIEAGNDRDLLPRIAIAVPGVTVMTTAGSGCYVARWDDIGTDVSLIVPTDSAVTRALRQRDLVPQAPEVGLMDRAASLAQFLKRASLQQYDCMP